MTRYDRRYASHPPHEVYMVLHWRADGAGRNSASHAPVLLDIDGGILVDCQMRLT